MRRARLALYALNDKYRINVYSLRRNYSQDCNFLNYPSEEVVCVNKWGDHSTTHFLGALRLTETRQGQGPTQVANFG